MPGDYTLSSLSVKERMRAMERRNLDCAMPSFSVHTTKQIAIQKQPPATLSDDDTESVLSSVTSANVSSSSQYTLMTLKAGQLRKDRHFRRSKSKTHAAAKKVDVANLALIDEPSAEERDPQQEVPKDMVPPIDAGAKRDNDTGAQKSPLPDEFMLDDVIDSLFEVEENAKQDDVEKMDDADGITERRDEADESRCSMSTVSFNKQSVNVDSAVPLPPTPTAQIGSLPHPPSLVRRTNIPVERSKYEPVTPDINADNERIGLLLPSATRAFLSLPTLDESPTDEELQDDAILDNLKTSSDEALAANDKEILEQILSENDSGSVVSCDSDDTDDHDCITFAISSIIRRPSLDDDEEDDSESDSISSPASLLGSLGKWSSRPFDWKERHTCVLRY